MSSKKMNGRAIHSNLERRVLPPAVDPAGRRLGRDSLLVANLWQAHENFVILSCKNLD